MYFKSFEIKNFKGIENIKVDLSGSPDGKVYTLVGLNESGKTTILEAINAFGSGSLEASLYEETHKLGDVQDFIPKGKKSNFTGKVEISALLVLEELDKKYI